MTLCDLVFEICARDRQTDDRQQITPLHKVSHLNYLALNLFAGYYSIYYDDVKIKFANFTKLLQSVKLIFFLASVVILWEVV